MSLNRYVPGYGELSGNFNLSECKYLPGVLHLCRHGNLRCRRHLCVSVHVSGRDHV